MVKLIRLSTGMFVIGDRKADFLLKPMLIEFKKNPLKNGEINIILTPPFVGLVEPGKGRFHVPKSEYFEVNPPKQMENMWRKATTGLEVPTLQDIKNIKKADN